MKTKTLLAAMILSAAACKKESAPQYGQDFTDKVVDLVIAAGNGQRISFPDLYTMKATRIPDPGDDRLTLADKLALRGFKVAGSRTEDAPLSGRHALVIEMVRDSCRCEISKVYSATENVSQYVQAESIRCYRTGLRQMP
jgi:hypothetical protein